MNTLDLIQLGETLLNAGLYNTQRDKDLLNSLYTFQSEIGKPLNGRCSSCISQAFYSLRPNIDRLKNSEIKITTDMDLTNKKFTLNVPPYRLDDKTVVTNANLTEEIALKIIDKYPKNWQVILTVTDLEEEVKEVKTTRKKKETTKE